MGWVAVYTIVITALSAGEGFSSHVLNNVFIMMGVQMAVFYLNSVVLLPYLLENKRYLFYGLSVLAVLMLTAIVMRMTEPFAFRGDDFANRPILPKHFHPDPHGEVSRLMIMRHGRMVMHGISMFGVLFVSTLVRNVGNRRKRELEKVKLENQIVEAESKFLKSQINPHFLFNALNNIYSLSELKSDEAPKAIHELSGMLRYVLYDSDAELVSIEDEVRYVKSYVELQKLKDSEMSGISFTTDIKESVQLAPMLLIPFVENAFKHGNFEEENGVVEIALKVDANELNFRVFNTLGDAVRAKDSVGGVGLENVRQRLELIYKYRFDLSVSESMGYGVNLNIRFND